MCDVAVSTGSEMMWLKLAFDTDLLVQNFFFKDFLNSTERLWDSILKYSTSFAFQILLELIS
jgi:hypothetical protein